MENKSLISLVSDTTKIELMLIESHGELTPEIEAALSVKETQLAEKVDGYAHVLDRLESLESHYKQKAEFYASVSKQCKSAAQRLVENLKFAMNTLGVDEIHGHDIRFKKAPTTGTLNIIDEELIPVEYKAEKVVTEIDKKRLKDDLKTKQIPGAQLEPGYSLRVYANTAKAKKGT